VARLGLPRRGPRALDTANATRRPRTVERWLSCRDRVLALIPFHAGPRLGEVVALDTDDIQLSACGAHDILNAIADTAHLDDDFTGHVLRHTLGTTLVREGHDLVLVAELLGHARLETVRSYSLPTDADRQNAINSLLTDR
jgi:site-specific recombinase XerC